MASGNKSLGRFDLTDIPPTPRGTPQIEVTLISIQMVFLMLLRKINNWKEQSIVIKVQADFPRKKLKK